MEQDNFAHDVIRYTTLDHEPLQCLVSIDSSGDFTELYEPVTDPLIARYLELRAKTPEYQRRPSPLLNPILAASPLLRSIFSAIPFAPNLTAPEFLPTKHLMLLDILRDKFPAHRVLFSDFSSLPDTIPGVNAPVVQTRYEGEVSPNCWHPCAQLTTSSRPSPARRCSSRPDISTSSSPPTFTSSATSTP